MNFVLDASVTMRWLFADVTAQELAYAAEVFEALQTRTAAVPGIWGLEVANALARAEAKAKLDEAVSEVFVATLRELNIMEDAQTSAQALSGSLALARRYRLTAYDAAYLELALRRELPLASLDRDLLRAAKRAGVRKFEAKDAR